MLDKTRDAKSIRWAVAAHVRPRTDNPGIFHLAGLFFPTSYSTGEEWADEYHLDKVSDVRIGRPDDWMSAQETVWGADYAFPYDIAGLRFWSDEQSDRYFVSVEVGAQELAIVRHMAHLAHVLGHDSLAGGFSASDLWND